MPMDDESLRRRLASLDRAQLLALVERLLTSEPGLVDVARLPLPGERAPFDASPLHARVTGILTSMGEDWEASYRAQFALDPVVAIADELVAAGALADARAAFRAIIDAILSLYLRVRDEESEIAHIVNDCVAGLGRTLDATEDTVLRERILRDVFHVFAWDRLQQGGYGMHVPARDILVAHTSAAERQMVLGWTLEARPHGATRSAVWGRRAAGELCLALHGEEAPWKVVEEVLAWSGMTRRYLQRLLSTGRHEEAVRVLAAAPDDVVAGAELLVSAGLEREAVEVVSTHRSLLDRDAWHLRRWLGRHGHDEQKLDELAHAIDRLHSNPTIGTWREVRAEATELGLWTRAAPRLLAAVDDGRARSQPVRARALAAVGRFDDALSVLETLADSARTSAGRDIARDAASTRPDIARPLLVAALRKLDGNKGPAARRKQEELIAELDALR